MRILNSAAFHPARRRNIRAFTLLELLTVMAIIAILAASMVPALQSLLESSNLSQAGQTLVGQISLARQLASSRGLTIEVRLIQTTPSASGYAGIQLWDTPSNSVPAAVTALNLLPQSVVISKNATLSPLLAHAATGTMSIPLSSSVNYASFGIMPSGLVDLSASTADEINGTGATSASTMKSLCLCVVAARYGAASSAPANYVTVQINPHTGTALVFRP